MRIEQPMTIYTAGELKPRLLDAVRTSDQPEFDLSDVSEIDTAGLQLLMLAKREADSLARPLHITVASTAVREVLDLVSIGVAMRPSPAPQTQNGGAE